MEWRCSYLDPGRVPWVSKSWEEMVYAVGVDVGDGSSQCNDCNECKSMFVKSIIEEETGAQFPEELNVLDVLDVDQYDGYERFDMEGENVGLGQWVTMWRQHIKAFNVLLQNPSAIMEAQNHLCEYSDLTPGFRDSEVSTIDYDYCRFQDVPQQMSELLELFNAPMHPIEKATNTLLRFLSIHPFQNGNGRLGRMWFASILCHYGINKFIHLTPRRRYIQGLKKAQRQFHGDKWFKWFCLHCVWTQVSNGFFPGQCHHAGDEEK